MLNAIAALGLATKIGSAANTLSDLIKKVKDAEAKHALSQAYDSLHELKVAAVALEDENRTLKEQLRFKSDEYVPRGNFYFHKDKPEQPLCAKCFHQQQKAVPLGPSIRNGGDPGSYRMCPNCGKSSDDENSRVDIPTVEPFEWE